MTLSVPNKLPHFLAGTSRPVYLLRRQGNGIFAYLESLERKSVVLREPNLRGQGLLCDGLFFTEKLPGKIGSAGGEK